MILTPAHLGEYAGRPCPGRDIGVWCAEPTQDNTATGEGWGVWEYFHSGPPRNTPLRRTRALILSAAQPRA